MHGWTLNALVYLMFIWNSGGKGWAMDGQWDNTDIIMLTFWSRSSSFSPLISGPVPRPARLRPPSPHSVHRARLRCRLGLGNRPRFASRRAGASEEASGLPGGVVDQAGAALYGLPPALAVQGLHIGLSHHHFGAGGAHARLVLRLHRSAEESTSKRNAQACWVCHLETLHSLSTRGHWQVYFSTVKCPTQYIFWFLFILINNLWVYVKKTNIALSVWFHF